MATRKDFIAAAKRIKYALDTCAADRGTVEYMARLECADYRRANPNFDEARFLRACGLL